MTDMERKTFCAALSRYGAQAQITMAFEEMAELQDVLCKFLRGRVDGDTLANIAHGLGGGKGAKPKPIPRPKPKPKQKRRKRLDVSRANVAALLFGARKQPNHTDGEGETT